MFDSPPPPPVHRDGHQISRLSLAFFCSGFGALLCQVVWQRMLGIFAGSDTVSASLVVGAFLMGLGLGSLLGAKIADRLSPARALSGFAACEAGVAVFAVVSKFFLYDTLAVGLAGVVDSPAAVFALCFAGLVLPTTLMGASLPLLARAVTTSLDTVAERVGMLYGLNTLGAGFGALLGGWVIVGTLGFVGALWVAAVLDLLAAAVALTLLPALRGAPSPRPGPTPSQPEEAAGFGSLRSWCLLVFLSGYVIVALEIVWVRFLGQVGQFHAYLFPTVLGVFLLADGLGIALASRFVRRLRDPRRAFFLVQSAGFVLAALLVGALWLALPHWPLAGLIGPETWRLRPFSLLTVLLLIGIVVGLPSLLIGMTFPLVQRAVQRDLATVGARVGWVQLANIAGNAAGFVGTGLVSLHFLGTMGTLKLLAAASILLLAIWLWQGRAAHAAGADGAERGGRWPELALAAACLAVMLLAPGNAAFWDRMHFRNGDAPVAWAEDRSGVAYWRDDQQDPEHPPGPIFIMGYAQGHIPFAPLHMLLGATGPLLHPDPRRVLLIDVGSGGSPWGALASPAARDVRAVELIGPVLDTLRDAATIAPAGPIAALLRDPRLTFQYGDGRRALSRGTELFDVIEADAILPHSSHSGMLNSREFMEQVRRRLAPGGLFVQWAPTWRVVDTVAAVFPHAVMLRPAGIMLGSNEPIVDPRGRLLARLAEPAVLEHLARGNAAAATLAEVVAWEPHSWAPGDPRPEAPLTDMRPRDEFFVNNGIERTEGGLERRTPAVTAR